MDSSKEIISNDQQVMEAGNQFKDSVKNSLRISRGYRLKVSTHNLVKNLSEMSGMDLDTLITQACLLLNKKIIEEKEISFKKDKEPQQ